MSMVKAYDGKKSSELQFCCSGWSGSLSRNSLTRDIQMEEEETWSWELSPTCKEEKNSTWCEPESLKYAPLDPPLEFQDNFRTYSLVEKFASDFVEKLISGAFLVSSKMIWSIPCSRDCHMSESLPSNSLKSWNGFRLCWTPELLPNKRLNSLSASHNSLSTIGSNMDDSSYIKSAVSHDVLTTKQISDMYNVPFDSDIYAVPIDVVRGKDPGRGRALYESEQYITTTYGSSQMERRSRKSRSGDASVMEPIHVTVEEVRQYLHTLYSSSEFSDGRSNREEVKQVKTPFKYLENNINGRLDHNCFKLKNNFAFPGKLKKTKETVETSGNRTVKFKKCRASFSANLKETLCSIFRIKKLPSSNHCLRRDLGSRSDDIGMRLNEHESLNHRSPISKPPFSKRALPPLPKPENKQGKIFATDSTPLTFQEEVCPPPLPFRTKEPSVPVDVTSSIEKVKDYGWYWGPISGEAAEKILSNEPDGSFIVRDSSDDYYIFSLTFKLNSIIRHVRIEHDKGNFSFGSSTRFKSHTIVDFIESAVEHSRSGRYLFFLHRRPVLGPMRVQLLHPVSRFKQVQSLQHMCRFVILKMVRRDLIPFLPLPRRVLDYLSTQHYYSEDMLDEDRNDSFGENLDQLLPFRFQFMVGNLGFRIPVVKDTILDCIVSCVTDAVQ